MYVRRETEGPTLHLLRIHPGPDPQRLSLAGELDAASAEMLSETLAAAQRRSSGDLYLDLSELEFMDSTGLHAFVVAARRTEGTGRLVLVSPTPAVLRVLELSGLPRVIPNLVVEMHDG